MSAAHTHNWDYTDWEYDDEKEEDVRERFCRGCPDANPESRSHQHKWTMPVPDLFREISTGSGLRICRACQVPELIRR